MTDPISYDAMTDEQKARCEQAMEVFARWLNSFHEQYNETWVNEAGAEVPVRVTRESYFEYSDAPHLLLDAAGAPTAYRIMVFSLNPYHDEGGPNELTCYYDRDDNAMAAYRDGEVRLYHMDQEFDTMIQPVWENGQYVSGPLEGKTDVTAQVDEGRR